MSTLEKIRAEIESIKDFEVVNGAVYVREYDVVQILDKYAEQEPCDDAVSREAILKQLRGCLTGGETEYQYVKLHINNIPSVRPQEQTGHWIKSKDGYMRCDQCGSRGSAIKARFCHHCGAKMESEG